MEYKESGVVDVVLPKSGFQSIKFKNNTEFFSNWLNKGKSNEHKPLSKGDIIDYNFDQKGQYRNITEFRIVTSTTPKEPRGPEPSIGEYKKASELPVSDALSKLPEVIGDAKKILNECKNAVLDVFDTEEIKPEMIACINTLYIYSSKEIQFRK